MKGSEDPALKIRLKELIINECELEMDASEIEDDVPLFGGDSILGLDSIDGLQIAVAVQNQYGIKITDGKEMRRIMGCINTFADYIQPK